MVKNKVKNSNQPPTRGSEGYPWVGRSIRKFRGHQEDEYWKRTNVETGDYDDACVSETPTATTLQNINTTIVTPGPTKITVQSSKEDDLLFCPVPNRGKSIKNYRESRSQESVQRAFSNEAFVEDPVTCSYGSFNNPGVEEVELQNFKDDNLEDEEFETQLVRSLPSRKLKSRHGTPESRSKSRGSVHPTDQGYEVILIGENSIPLQSMPRRQNSVKEALKDAENIRRMTVSLEDKKKIKKKKKGGRKERPISSWVEFKFSTSIKVRRTLQNVKNAMSSFHLWQSHMKRVQGMFGTGVLSYFVFLRWLVYVNFFICILLISFLVVPQSIYERSNLNKPQSIYERSYLNKPVNFTGLELLTGEGWFTHTALYYGHYYMKITIYNQYNMKMAYLLVGSGHILLCLAILVVSIGKSYKENYIVGGESFTRFSSKVFCAWDYSISNEATALLKEQSIYRDILETVGPSKDTSDMKVSVKCRLLFTRIGTWFISFVITAASIFLVVVVSSDEGAILPSQGKHQVINSMLPAITISLVNIIIPPVFRMISLLENYASSETTVNVNLFRTILLQLASICVYVAYLYIGIKKSTKIECWETRVGQVFYKLVIIDFIATLLSTFLNEFLRNFFSKYCCHEYKPRFDISKNVLNLIYGQGLCWLGSFFSPLLPVINILKLLIIFYVKRLSVTRNCKPSVKPFKASKMDVLFRLLLSIMLIFTCIVNGVVVLDKGTMKPSQECGPFRNEARIYDVVTAFLENLEWFKKIVEIITSWVVIGAAVFIMVLLAYYFRLKKNTTEKKIEGLKYQLTLASQDKQYLIRQIKVLIKTSKQADATGTASKEKVT